MLYGPLLLLALFAAPLTPVAAAQNQVLHYRLNETSGTVVSDSSGNGLDAVLMGTTAWVPGQVGGGLELDGFSGHARAAADPLHDISQLTIAAWVKSDVLGDWDGVLTKGIVTSPYALQLGFPIGKFKFTANWGNPVGGVGGGTWTSSADLLPGVWHHLAVTFDGSEVRLYLDGALDSVHAAGGTILGTDPGSLTLGADFPGGDEFFDGVLDDVRLFDGPLPAASIAILAGGSGPLGTTYCSPALPNSTGQPGILTIAGSPSIPINDVTLTASQLPPGQFGFFLISRTQGVFVPPGSQGILCLTGNIGRFNNSTQIIQGPTGSLQIDLLGLPQNPPVAALPGDVFNFQAWHREAGSSNFTDAVEVMFQ